MAIDASYGFDYHQQKTGDERAELRIQASCRRPLFLCKNYGHRKKTSDSLSCHVSYLSQLCRYSVHTYISPRRLSYAYAIHVLHIACAFSHCSLSGVAIQSFLLSGHYSTPHIMSLLSPNRLKTRLAPHLHWRVPFEAGIYANSPRWSNKGPSGADPIARTFLPPMY